MAMYEQDTFLESKTAKLDELPPETRSLRQDMLELSDELTEAIEELRESGRESARKDNAMRIAKAKSFLLANGKNKEEREAKADPAWQKERLDAKLAESDRETCLEKVRSLRAQLSALQSLMYANRAEGDSIRYGQTQTT